jgi:hypothetical protein
MGKALVAIFKIRLGYFRCANNMKKFFKIKDLPRTDLKKYSRLGIASFILAVITVLIIIFDVGIFLRFQNTLITEYFKSLDSFSTWLAGCVALAGIVLGFAAVVQKKKKRLFGFVGLFSNGLFLLSICSLYGLDAYAFWRMAGG